MVSILKFCIHVDSYLS